MNEIKQNELCENVINYFYFIHQHKKKMYSKINTDNKYVYQLWHIHRLTALQSCLSQPCVTLISSGAF